VEARRVSQLLHLASKNFRVPQFGRLTALNALGFSMALCLPSQGRESMKKCLADDLFAWMAIAAEGWR
jgi:hypothetical protein